MDTPSRQPNSLKIRSAYLQPDRTRRGCPDHQPALLWPMLAVRFNQRLPYPTDESIPAPRIRTQPGLPLLLG